MVNEKSKANLRKFSKDYQPKKKRSPGRGPTQWLNYFANRKTDCQNPFNGKTEKLPIDAIVAIKHILKCTQDDEMNAIKEYYDRRDGKVPQKIEGELRFNQLGDVIIDGKKFDPKVGE